MLVVVCFSFIQRHRHLCSPVPVSSIGNRIHQLIFVLVKLFQHSIMDASSHYVRDIQRRNGKLIIRAMLAVGKATFETIVEKLCSDYNVSIDLGTVCLKRRHRHWKFQIIFEKEIVENAVRSFLRNGFYSGFLDVNDDESFAISHAIRHHIEDEFKEQSTKRSSSPSAPTNSSKKTCNSTSKKWFNSFWSNWKLSKQSNFSHVKKFVKLKILNENSGRKSVNSLMFLEFK